MKNYKIMIVEDESLIAGSISMSLQRLGYSVLEPVATAEESISEARRLKPDLIFMDIVLQGEMDGIEAAERIRNEMNIPIIFISTYTDEHIVKRAATQMPFGYILKPFRANELEIVIKLTQQRHSYEKHLKLKNSILTRKLIMSRDQERRMQEISLVDELTGLYNRRGFHHLIGHQMEIAKRMKKVMLLAFFDLDHMKEINDNHGHLAGDMALCAAAGILKKIFRGSDIISRWGGDEFAVIMMNTDTADRGAFDERIIRAVNEYNDGADHRFMLSMSWGTVKYDPAIPMETEELITRADEIMYRNKSLKKI